MSMWLWRATVTVLLFSSLAHGEGGCPAGMIPASGTNINSCIPIPAGYARQPAASIAPPAIWADRWGAVATDSVKGVLGVATDMVTKDEAETVALLNCTANGGAHCIKQTWYRNGCAVMVLGDAGFNVGNAGTVEEATRQGMEICTKSNDTNCHVYYSGCSLPQRIQ